MGRIKNQRPNRPKFFSDLVTKYFIEVFLPVAVLMAQACNAVGRDVMDQVQSVCKTAQVLALKMVES